PSTPSLYHLSLHDALPICSVPKRSRQAKLAASRSGSSIGRARKSTRFPSGCTAFRSLGGTGRALHRTSAVARKEIPCTTAHLERDRKSTRLNSSHEWISYA